MGRGSNNYNDYFSTINILISLAPLWFNYYRVPAKIEKRVRYKKESIDEGGRIWSSSLENERRLPVQGDRKSFLFFRFKLKSIIINYENLGRSCFRPVCTSKCGGKQKTRFIHSRIFPPRVRYFESSNQSNLFLTALRCDICQQG